MLEASAIVAVSLAAMEEGSGADDVDDVTVPAAAAARVVAPLVPEQYTTCGHTNGTPKDARHRSSQSGEASAACFHARDCALKASKSRSSRHRTMFVRTAVVKMAESDRAESGMAGTCGNWLVGHARGVGDSVVNAIMAQIPGAPGSSIAGAEFELVPCC